MAPSKRLATKKQQQQQVDPLEVDGKVVGSVVKTKLVQETIQVVVADDDPTPTSAAAAAAAKPIEIESVVPQSQETQDPNAKEADEEAGMVIDGAQDKVVKKPGLPETTTPGTPAKEANKTKIGSSTTSKVGKTRKKTKTTRRKKKRVDAGYKLYVWRVLKQVHPDMGVSGRAMEVLDMMMADMFERLAEEAARVAKYTGRATLSSREVQTAVRLVLPGELAKHAISEGVKAVTRFMAA